MVIFFCPEVVDEFRFQSQAKVAVVKTKLRRQKAEPSLFTIDYWLLSTALPPCPQTRPAVQGGSPTNEGEGQRHTQRPLCVTVRLGAGSPRSTQVRFLTGDQLRAHLAPLSYGCALC